MSTPASLTLTARHNPSAAEARRGIIRVHPEVLTALSLREWDAVSITGARVTAAVVAATEASAPTGVALLDEIAFSNAGVRENSTVVLAPVEVQGASRVVVSGSALATQSITESTLRRALLGKVLSVGDAVSLLPRDLGPELAATEATRALARSVGITWTTELLTVTATEPGPPAGGPASTPVSVQTNTAVLWSTTAGEVPPLVDRTGPGSPRIPGALGMVSESDSRPRPVAAPSPVREPAREPEIPVRPVSELVGVDSQITKLTEWLTITLDEPEVLRTLGATPRLGVLVTGPAGGGKATFVRSVCASRTLVTIDGPTVGATEANTRLRTVADAVARTRAAAGVLLITDVDALLPAEPEPVAALILDELRSGIADGRIALIATTAEPVRLDARLRDPSLCDRELVIGLPDAATRARLLSAILSNVPTDGDLDLTSVASRTPGFVAGDLAALAREAA
ncbi:AAA family ATPase, partial [Gordonia sp. ALPHA2A]